MYHTKEREEEREWVVWVVCTSMGVPPYETIVVFRHASCGMQSTGLYALVGITVLFGCHNGLRDPAGAWSSGSCPSFGASKKELAALHGTDIHSSCTGTSVTRVDHLEGDALGATLPVKGSCSILVWKEVRCNASGSRDDSRTGHPGVETSTSVSEDVTSAAEAASRRSISMYPSTSPRSAKMRLCRTAASSALV